MAQIKRRTLILTSGKQIKMAGTAFCISPSLEIGEGFTNNIFGLIEPVTPADKTPSQVNNPYQLSAADIHELADLHIRYWIDLKEAVRESGTKDTGIFKRNG